jgi:hypothetical protein
MSSSVSLASLLSVGFSINHGTANTHSYLEGTTILYSTNTFAIDYYPLYNSLETALPNKMMTSIKSLEISFGQLDWARLQQQFDPFSPKVFPSPLFPSLTHLRIAFDQGPSSDRHSVARRWSDATHDILPSVDMMIARLAPAAETIAAVVDERWGSSENRVAEDDGVTAPEQPVDSELGGFKYWWQIPVYGNVSSERHDSVSERGEQIVNSPGYWVHFAP